MQWPHRTQPLQLLLPLLALPAPHCCCCFCLHRHAYNTLLLLLLVCSISASCCGVTCLTAAAAAAFIGCHQQQGTPGACGVDCSLLVIPACSSSSSSSRSKNISNAQQRPEASQGVHLQTVWQGNHCWQRVVLP
jgi:hypothetical protein